MATVFILITAQGVAAGDNFKRLSRLTDVTWIEPSNPESFQVVFTEFQPQDGPRQTNIPVQGPFSQPLSSVGGQATGTIRADAEDGVYFYEIHGDNGFLPWLNPIGPPPDNFAGVEVHGPPPRQTS